jgi:uncharacterized protein (TIGR00369 family)
MGSIEERARNFLGVLRHCQFLGMSVEQADEKGLLLKLPYDQRIVGNPVTGVIHGGAITTLMDTCCCNTLASMFMQHLRLSHGLCRPCYPAAPYA